MICQALQRPPCPRTTAAVLNVQTQTGRYFGPPREQGLSTWVPPHGRSTRPPAACRGVSLAFQLILLCLFILLKCGSDQCALSTPQSLQWLPTAC